MELLRIAFLVAVSALVGLSSSAPAGAQGLKDNLTAPESNWTGFYLGAGGGLNSLVSEVDAKPGSAVSSDPGAAGASASFDGLGASGGFGTLVIGGDYQLHPRVVIGAFGEYDFEDLGSEATLNIPGNSLSAHADINVNGKASVGARIGYLVSPGTLLYVSAGYSRISLSDLKLTVTGSNPDITATVNVPSLSGVFIGAGAETMLTERISVRGEFRYTDFGSGPVTLPTIDGTNLNDFVSARLSPTMQEGRVTLNYRF
jgi:outer membrane immunogenic protein